MRRCLSFFLFFLALTGCVSSSHLAPVVNGWLQPKAKSSTYRVKKGDTIYSIAWAFGLDYRALAATNHLSPPYQIQAGQTLRMTTVPRGAHVSRSASTSPRIVYMTAWRPSQPTHPVSHWQWPAKGKVVDRYSQTIGGNQGVDIVGRYGEPVRAAANGVVVYSGAGVRGYGNLIIVKHNDSYLSAYAFNKRILVKEGSRVRAGQKIAEMGRTDAGRVMLHFEIRRDGKPMNPLRYLS